MLVIHCLLPVSALLFLLPLNPIYSSWTILLWIFASLATVSLDTRWVAWPLLFVLAIFNRSWLLNQMPHPISQQDGLLFVASVMVGALTLRHHWSSIIRLPLLAIPLLVFQLGEHPLLADELIRNGRHWTPNYLAGANQGAYLLGLLFLLAFATLCQKVQPSLIRIFSSAVAFPALVMIWYTGSRAALVSISLAVVFAFLLSAWRSKVLLKNILILGFSGVAILVIKQIIRPSSAGIPGVDILSDLGRLVIARCYALLPFSGNNRLLFGIGFFNVFTYKPR